MRKTLFIMLLALVTSAKAQDNSDSLAYELQKKKINKMLEARLAKFGDFDESLKRKTGIFGNKRKKDMQKSMDILVEIAQTDNQIIKETKVLLDLKSFQQEKEKDKSVASEEKSIAYMHTLNKLQTENEKVKNEMLEHKKSLKFYQLTTFGLALAIAGILLFVFRKISLK